MKPDEFNVFKGVMKNRLFMGIVGLIVVLQVVIVMFLRRFMYTVRLSWQLWLVSIAIGFIRYSPVGHSFYHHDMGRRQPLGEGLESWRGFYQSIRPTQMGLSLNIDMPSTPFIEQLL